MRFLKFTSDKVVRQLRWFVVCAICLDATLTLLGQPSTYWHNHQTALEGNPFFLHYLYLGYVPFCLVMLGFAAVTFSVISILPREAALVLIFYYLFIEFFTTETWLMFHWKFGFSWLTVYGSLFGATVVMLGFPKQIRHLQTPPNTTLESTAPPFSAKP